MFQDDYPTDEQDFPKAKLPPKAHVPKGTFRVIRVTPHSLELVQRVIDTSANFDRALKEDCEAALNAYGDLIQARGKLVKYMARLMDMAGDASINQQRTSQVRYD